MRFIFFLYFRKESGSSRRHFGTSQLESQLQLQVQIQALVQIQLQHQLELQLLVSRRSQNVPLETPQSFQSIKKV